MHALTAPLSELAEIEEICKERGREPGMLLLSGCVTSQKTHLMYALGKDYGHTLIVPVKIKQKNYTKNIVF